MKYILLFLPLVLFAKSYMAKIEPLQTYTFYAQTQGEVIKLDTNDETKLVNKELITLESSLERQKLALLKEQLKLLKQELSIREKNYKKFIAIRGKSQFDKDDKLIEILNLKSSIATTNTSIKELEDTLAKKSIYVKKLYVKSFHVNLHDYVSAGTKLATAYDLSKGKLRVCVNKEDYQNIKNKTIFINGKASNTAVLNKVDLTPDETYISSYWVEVLVDEKHFGKLLSVEFK